MTDRKLYKIHTTTNNMLKQFPLQTIENPYKVGFYGGVYKISENHVAKTERNWNLWNDKNPCPYLEKWLDNLETILKTNISAYEAGLNIPKPEGIYLISLKKPGIISHFKQSQLVPALINQQILGIPKSQIKNRHERKLASKRFYDEIEKAKSLGFSPGDHKFDGNSLWDGNKIYLIDLDDWKIPQ